MGEIHTQDGGESPLFLLDDPHILLDEARRPRNVSRDLAYATVLRWVREQARRSQCAPFLTDLYPVPVGVQALAKDLAKMVPIGRQARLPRRGALRERRYLTVTDIIGAPMRTVFRADAVNALAPLMPFDGTERAAFILPVCFPRARATLFGLGTIAGDDSEMFTLAECKFATSGTYPDDKDVLQWTRAARRWWNTAMRGQKMRSGPRTGRPEKQFTADEIKKAYQLSSNTAASLDERESKAGLAAELGTSPKTLNKNLSRLGLRFPPE